MIRGAAFDALFPERLEMLTSLVPQIREESVCLGTQVVGGPVFQFWDWFNQFAELLEQL